LSLSEPVVVIGAGHAGVAVAASLRDEGYQEDIVLLNNEPFLPYQRPPLSKAYMKREADLGKLVLRAKEFYEGRRISLVEDSAVDVDRRARRVWLRSGGYLSYAHLIFATGSRQRALRFAGGDGVVHSLGSFVDAERLRADLDNSESILIIGAGFIGLELASVARELGRRVDLVELASRPLARTVSGPMSQFFAAEHAKMGSTLHFSKSVAELHFEQGTGHVAILTDGSTVRADMVIGGVGVSAEDTLAAASGLHCNNGIVVGPTLLTNDPLVSAIGDCARHPNPFAEDLTRLESVQNATEQARTVARRMVGKPVPYTALPWFWSDQSDLKLQIAGLGSSCDQYVTRGDPQDRAFSIFGFSDGRLRVVESVCRPGEHMAARRIISGGVAITPEQAADRSFDLKLLVNVSVP
jgi:3-phenylpropionate/trans-cinnamate dioxygenase ferredoxin reductase component